MYSRARYEALRERLGADADAEQPRADLPERVSSMLRGPDELTPLDAAGVAFAEWLLENLPTSLLRVRLAVAGVCSVFPHTFFSDS